MAKKEENVENEVTEETVEGAEDVPESGDVIEGEVIDAEVVESEVVEPELADAEAEEVEDAVHELQFTQDI